MKEDGFPCAFCPNHFSRKQNLKKHIKDIHPQSKLRKTMKQQLECKSVITSVAPITEGAHSSLIPPCRMDGNGFLTDPNLFVGQDQGSQALEGTYSYFTQQHSSLVFKDYLKSTISFFHKGALL